MSRHLKSIFTVSLGTFGSRLFGLLRDVTMAAFLGISAASNAFIFAFTVPNLFRRLLGEGALTSAFVPVLSRITSDSSDADSHAFINRVLTRLLVATLALSAILALLYAGAHLYLNTLPPAPLPSAEAHTAAQSGSSPWLNATMIAQWTDGMVLGIILLPYLPMVCLAAILAAALNVKGHFAVPAASPVLLNLCMIGALLLGGLAMGLEGTQLALFLSLGTLVGGLLQLLAPAAVLYKRGWRPRLDFSSTPHMALLWRLFVPGVLGAAALQINVLVSRVLAFGLNDTATTTLNYVNRLVELPLGLFAISIATVVFPQMSLYLSSGRHAEYRQSFSQGLRLTLAVTLPATVGLIVLAEPVLTLLFRWGRFSAEDVSLMVPLLTIAAIGIPFYAVSTFLTRAFHARENTRSPARIAVVVLVVNLGLCLLLMGRYEASGLAAANTIAAAIQVALLARGLRQEKEKLHCKPNPLTKALVQIFACCLIMAMVVAFGNYLTTEFMADVKSRALLSCLLLIPIGALLYGWLLWVTGFEDRHAIADIFRRKLGNRK